MPFGLNWTPKFNTLDLKGQAKAILKDQQELNVGKTGDSAENVARSETAAASAVKQSKFNERLDQFLVKLDTEDSLFTILHELKSIDPKASSEINELITILRGAALEYYASEDKTWLDCVADKDKHRFTELFMLAYYYCMQSGIKDGANAFMKVMDENILTEAMARHDSNKLIYCFYGIMDYENLAIVDQIQNKLKTKEFKKFKEKWFEVATLLNEYSKKVYQFGLEENPNLTKQHNELMPMEDTIKKQSKDLIKALFGDEPKGRENIKPFEFIEREINEMQQQRAAELPRRTSNLGT